MQSAWVSILIATALALFTAYVIATVCKKKHQGQTIFQIIEKLVGGKASKVLGILFLLFIIFFGILLRAISIFLTL
ncbi:hypothetical protein GCM10020331_020930 [Ectobacillus funiculus]